MSRRRIIILIVFLVIIIVLVSWYILSRGKERRGVVQASGVFEGQEVVVSAEVPGKVITVHQDSGDEVVKGEALLDLDTTDTILQISQARANLAKAQEGIVQAQTQLSLAESNYRRMKEMYDSGNLAESLLEQSANALELAQSGVQAATEARRQAQAQVNLLTHQLEKAKVDSPISGQILERYVEAGELVNVGTKLFSVADLSHLWLDVYVPESKLGLVQVGQEVEIAVDSFPDEVFPGKVIFINGEAEFTPKNIQTKEERSKLVYRVRLEVPNPDNKLKIGMPADADILVGE
jgi:HlyD family secretion protein